MRITFPVISKKSMYPERAICPICRKNKVLEPHSFAYLWGGAMEKKGRDYYSSEIESNRILGVLELAWHGAHDDGEGEFREIDSSVKIVDNAAGGNFSLFFCSTSCLREFLNKAVDKLEKEIGKLEANRLRAKKKKRK